MEENQNSSNVVKSKKIKKRLIVVISFIIAVIIVAYVIFRGNYLEMLEIGENYVNVFWENVRYMSITLLINFAVVYVLVYYTNIKIKKGLKEFFDQENKKMPKFLNKSIAFISAIIVSATTSSFILKKALMCFNSSEFGITDTIFGLDIGYFMFIKPFIEMIIVYFMVAVVVLLIYTVLYYIITFNMFFDGIDRKTLKNSKLIKQIINVIRILTLLFAVFILLKSQDIGIEKFLTIEDDSSTYSLYGAGFTDINIKLWGYRIGAVVLIISVYMAIKAFKQSKTKKLIMDILIVPTYLVGLFIIMVGVQELFVNNNEYDKEKQYISTNISFTKNAYGINIEEISLEDASTINSEDIENYENILNNVAIVSEDILLKDLNNGQTSKGYYSYRTTKIGKYNVNGTEQLLYITPREVVSNTGTYNNKTYEYTHGYSTIISSATETTESGNINNLQKGFSSTDDVVTITEPRIYFGLETNDTVVTNSNGKTEFDYPVLDSNDAENAENVYDGEAGLSLNFIDRIIIAIKEGDLKLAFSSNVTKESKILINRNVIERAKTILPYLKYDEDPYTVITEDGKIVWVLDAYTISDKYPYSQKTVLQENATTKLELNYIRNSVKVIIDAYDGTTKFYITDRTDPIAMVYYNMYPGLFEDLDEEIPVDISSHFVYSEYLYNIQAEIITRYHNIQPDVLYRGDDVWNIATHNTGKVATKTGTEIEPYYTMIKTVNSDKEELGLVLPYTPLGKQNLISYVVGTCDNSGSSKLTIYKYQANSNILGPMQLDTQLEEDETISKEMETLNVNGVKITKNMIIVPLDNTLLYVEPIYTQYINEKNALPVLKKVVVASGTKVAIGDDLKEALTNLVSQYAVDIEVENTDTIDDLIDTIIKANNNLTTSSESNDWEMTGKDIKKLQELIDKLEVLVEEDKSNKQNAIDTNEIVTNSINNDIVNDI
jgi:hypothetical protein